eukprot:COSAG02_NODE_7361_length_3048_cov_10.028155_4_plen_96_part_00
MRVSSSTKKRMPTGGAQNPRRPRWAETDRIYLKLIEHGSPRPMGIPDTWPMTVPPIESCSDFTTRMSDAILHAVGACGQRTGTAITCNHLHHDGQ